MSKIFITGSADGLGQLSAKSLIQQGHKVVLHARNVERGHVAIKKNPGAECVLTGDLSKIEETKKLADAVNEAGLFDVVIHNAGVYQTSPKEIFNVNVLAPYILTSLIQKPKRLIYLSSGMHLHGIAKFDTFDLNRVTYSDSKLYVLMLGMAVARKWNNVFANTVNPGWVPTKMGGPGAPDSIEKGFETQVWLAVSNDPGARVSGCYFYHKRKSYYLTEADDKNIQDKFLAMCEKRTGVSLDA